MFDGLFSYFVSDNAAFYFPQAPFVLAGMLLGVGIVCALAIPNNATDDAHQGAFPPLLDEHHTTAPVNKGSLQQ